MFRILQVGPSGPVELHEGSSHVGPPPEACLRWIDVSDQDEAQLEILREQFHFHPLPIEDCLHFDQRPKVEEYTSYLFVVTQGFACQEEQIQDLAIKELHAFIAGNYLVTVHTDEIEALEIVWRRAAGDPELVRRGVDFLYYLIADRMVDDNFPILDKITEELELLEDAVLYNPARKDLTRIFELKHHLVTMRKVLSPQRDVLATLSKRSDPHISERTVLYYRDIYDHLLRINESIEANRDLLGNALEAYLSSVSQRTNEIMKYLTIMSAVFLPLAFVVGFFGQNFDNLGSFKQWIHSDTLMWVMLFLCLAIPISMIQWFRHKQWL